MRERGGSDRLLTYGIKETPQLHSSIVFGQNAYAFELKPTVDGAFTFADERVYFFDLDCQLENSWRSQVE